ncbi:MAG TPA: 2-phospho-L-lactate guanylyltransferase [Archaeoglobaceae archaeon]|nr:2-phospho-L-lactate guanylyltransferase [Archaeoglobaceae archaeon]
MVKIVIPFKPHNPKSRLSDVLSLEERNNLMNYMLLDVIDAVRECSEDVLVLSSGKIEFNVNCEVKEDSRSLDEAVNSVIDENVAIVMSDLPLLTPEVLKRFISCEGDVVIAPGRRGGTNMLLVRDKKFRVSYHYGSMKKHLKIAEKLGLNVRIFDSFYAGVDIDDRNDLLELMIHGKGRSRDYLEKIGFRVDYSSKDPALCRIQKFKNQTAEKSTG